MAKLYWAGSKDSEVWDGPFETIEACKADARESYCDLDGEIWVAPIDAETDDDEKFWDAMAQCVLFALDDPIEWMVEDGWLDHEDPEIATNASDPNGILARALREVLGPRPAWRQIDTAKAERVEL